MSIINQLVEQAKSTDIDKFGTRFASTDVDGKLLCVTITYHKGGDGQVRKVDARTSWVFDGKNISRANLDKALA